MAYFRLGQHAQAIADLERAATDSSLTAASRLLAAAYISGGRIDQGLQLYQRLLQTASSPLQRGEYLLALAEIAYRQERYDQAIATCRELLALDFAEEERPSERTYYLREKGHWLMADAALRLENYQAVADAATAGLAAYPSGFYAPDFLFLGGLAALQLDRYEEAVGHLQDSITRYPEHTPTLRKPTTTSDTRTSTRLFLPRPWLLLSSSWSKRRTATLPQTLSFA